MLKRIAMIFLASPRQLAAQELHHAQRELVNHGCQAEYHAAMATMYAERVARLQHVCRDHVGEVGLDPLTGRISA